jgi:hypothetical protein
LAMLWGGGLASAQQSGTAAEARAMLDRAVVVLKADKATALSAFNDKSNKQFHDRDLYVFCQNISDGKLTAHPNPALMGTDGRALKFRDDAIGQRVSTRFRARRKEASPQWNITSRSLERPSRSQSYMTRGGDQGCDVGYYK